jgi:hypothetical protein
MATLRSFSAGQLTPMEVWRVNIAALTLQAAATWLLAARAPGVLVLAQARLALLSLFHQLAVSRKPTVKSYYRI